MLCSRDHLGIDIAPWRLHGHTFKPLFHVSLSILGVMQLAKGRTPQVCFSHPPSLLELALWISLRGYLPLSMEDSKAAASLKSPAQPEWEILKCMCMNFTACTGCSVMADLGVSALPTVVYNLGEGLWKPYQFQELPVPCSFYLFTTTGESPAVSCFSLTCLLPNTQQQLLN